VESPGSAAAGTTPGYKESHLKERGNDEKEHQSPNMPYTCGVFTIELNSPFCWPSLLSVRGMVLVVASAPTTTTASSNKTTTSTAVVLPTVKCLFKACLRADGQH